MRLLCVESFSMSYIVFNGLVELGGRYSKIILRSVEILADL